MTTLSSAVSLDDPEQLFKVIEVVGQGSFGIVCTCEDLKSSNGRVVAIKFIEMDEEDDSGGNKGLLRELDIMKSSNSCKHIVSYHGSYMKEGHLMIVMEYCDGGSVQDLLKMCKIQLIEDEIAAIAHHMLEGLAYLHGDRVLHRDIKAGNVLLSSEGKAKLADFGVSARLMTTDQRQRTVVGSPYWMSPEVIMSSGYDHKADIWSLGITCIEMAEGIPPHYEMSPVRVIFIIPHRPPPTLKEPAKWSPEFSDFLSKCLCKDPSARATAQELLAHPFITRAAQKGSDRILMDLVNKSIPLLIEARARKAAKGSDEEEGEDEDGADGGLDLACGSVVKINTKSKRGELVSGTKSDSSFSTVVYKTGQSEDGGTVVYRARTAQWSMLRMMRMTVRRAAQ